MRRHWAAAVCLALWAAPAFSQYVSTLTPGVQYPTLTSPTSIALQAPAATPPNDRGRATVPMGFNFPFYNKTYSAVTVTANGMLFLEPSTAINLTSDFGFNFAMPNVGAEPKAIIAPFWDDLDGKNASSVLRRQAVFDASKGGTGLAIEWSNWSEVFGTYDLNFQVRLWPNGLVDFYYGNMIGTGGTPSITCGIESPDGSKATQSKPCALADGGMTTAACTLADFPNDVRISFGPAPGPDISVLRLQVDSIVPSGGNLQIATSVFLRNFGSLATGAFKYRLYLSADTVYDPSDLELSPTPHAVASIPALGSFNESVTSTVARPAAGTYYVLVVADSDSEVTESNELNNSAINGVPLSNGVDLVAENIVGPPLGGPGDMVSNTVTFSNQGLDPAGSVKVRILLSIDTLPDVTDRIVYDGTLSVAGGQNVNQALSYLLAGSVPAGDYYFILQLDPDNTIAELDETNNLKVSLARFTAMQADLIVESMRVLRTDAPYNPASVAFFGEQIRLEAVVKNQGGASAPNVTVVFYLSDNETLNGITDPFIVDVPGLALPSGQSQTVTVTATVPTKAVDMSVLAAGPYFFFAAAVGVGLNETQTNNNALKSPPMLVRTPAPDLTATLIVGPAQIGAGEQMVVTRTLGNIGNRPAAGVRYRYYLSANTIVTPNDLPLKIKTSTGLVDDRIVALGVGASDHATEIVEVPQSVLPATYYLGVLLDPELQVDEVDHENNGLAGQQITVVAPGLAIDTPALPDALLGAPYSAQLAGRGGDGTYQWSLAPGSTPPPGLTLSAQGFITGTPTAEGAFSVGLRLSSDGRIADAVRVLRVVTATTSLFVSTVDLPSPARMVPYEAHLAAGGGRAPYTWSVETGVLPQGITLATDGTLSGQAQQALGTRFDFAVRVRDSVGNTDVKAFTLVIVDATALIITTYSLPVATAGSPYAVDIQAQNAGMAPLSTPLTWSLATGFLPSGLQLMKLDDKLLISGTPLVAGIFPFSIEVVDARGRSDSSSLVLEVRAQNVTVQGDVPAELVPSQRVSVQFTLVGPAPARVVWTVRDGKLPDGLSMDESGLLSGDVAANADLGTYSFIVAPTADGKELTFATYSTDVVTELSAKRGCGCSGAEGLLVLGAVAMLLRRRRAV
ncbi:MAG: hypothetical protein IPJ65_18715 [Archangiaceae bacterium]|nr:hypothetical protein [Archangiaceae bacterium]